MKHDDDQGADVDLPDAVDVPTPHDEEPPAPPEEEPAPEPAPEEPPVDAADLEPTTDGSVYGRHDVHDDPVTGKRIVGTVAVGDYPEN